MPSSLFTQGPTEAFPYRVEGQVGEGAMGVVYSAREVDLERRVAIKVLREIDSGPEDEIRRRFLQEARAAAALSHPGVTTVHRIGTADGSPYIVMEWLEGATLETLIRRDGPMSLEQAGGHVLEILDVLGAAHAAGIVHRDIKPSNLVVTESGRLKVTDFGIALLQNSDLVKTQAGSVLATPQYASPEQLQGDKVDGRSDLFSTALVLYYLLTAHLPWTGDSLAQLFVALLQKPPVPIRRRMPELPQELEVWFEKALARDRDQRFANTEQMAAGLRRVLGPGAAGVAAAAPPAAEKMRSTHPMPAPVSLFTAPKARTSWQAAYELIQSWEAHQLTGSDRQGFLGKLLEKPLHAQAFAGAAVVGHHCLLIEQGVLLASIDLGTGRLEPDAEHSTSGDIHLYTAPADLRPGTIALLASGLDQTPARYQGLDSETVNLSAFAGKLMNEGFEGVMKLCAGERCALVLLLGDRTELALLGGDWPQDPKALGWEAWLSTTQATASFHERVNRPPAAWFRHGFRSLELAVRAELPASGGSGKGPSDSTLSAVFGTEEIADLQLFRTRLKMPEQKQSLVPTESAPMMKFFDWMLEDLPRLLVERGKADGWKYLSNWLLHVHRAHLYHELERPGGGQTDFFDLATEDEDGKVLHLGHRCGELDADGFQEFVERVKTAKSARIKRGDVGGAFLICPSFTKPVLDAYRSLLNQGASNRFLGIDRSMGYEGFVRMSTLRGFHLLLVEEREDGFRPRFLAA